MFIHPLPKSDASCSIDQSNLEERPFKLSVNFLSCDLSDIVPKLNFEFEQSDFIELQYLGFTFCNWKIASK